MSSNHSWQRNPLFKFFASVKLAMLLLAVLILASIAGTIYESNFDAKIARAYIYGAPWFILWLLLLAANLACAAFSRMPWKKHHTGFLITHLGIIVLLAGSVIGKIWGVEGTMTLYKDKPPENRLVIDEKFLHIREDASSQLVPLEFYNRKPTPEKPRFISKTPEGTRLEAIGYSNQLEMALETESVPNGIPGIRISISTAMMQQKLGSWLLADHPEHGLFGMGLANISFKRGVAPDRSPATEKKTAPVEIEEAVFAFEKIADQVTNVKTGGNSGIKVRLLPPNAAGERLLAFDYQGQKSEFKIAEVVGKTVALPKTPFKAEVRDYWPDFRITKEGPQSLSQEPNNPAVLVWLRGKAVPVAVSEPAESSPNSLVIYISEDGKLSYDLSSRKAGRSSGALELAKPLPTGWADWALVVEQLQPSVQAKYVATPATQPAIGMGARRTEGVLLRATHQGGSLEKWVPMGLSTELATVPKPLRLSYGYRQEPLPIGLQLKEFEVERNEGTDTPAGFKSTLLITDIQGNTASGQCWMNNPMSYPGSWLNTFSGLTYKISQASWNPEDLAQSSVQILRDPGWGLKWIGSLLITAGIFILFYLRPPKNFNKRPNQ